MTARPYAPTPGSVSHRVIEHLRTLGPGAEMPTAQLAICANFDSKQAAAFLAAALKAGALARRKEPKGRQMLWRVGNGEPLPPGDPIETAPRASRREPRAPIVPKDYPPGYFTELMRAHSWPPGFISQGCIDPGALKRQEAAVRGRATQLANGHTGSMRNGLSKKSAAVLPSIDKAAVHRFPGKGVDMDAVHRKAVKA